MSHLIQNTELSYQAAMILAAQVIEHANAENLNICISILCPKGLAILSLNMNQAPLHSAKIAFDKAYTSASFGLASHHWKEKLANKPSTLQALSLQPNFTALGGGFPLLHQNQMIGAIGISGATEEEDRQCTQVAITALHSLLNPPSS